MAMAKKCDRCGKLYELYTDDNGRNGFAYAKIDRPGQANFFMAYDLCPECMKLFTGFMVRKEVKSPDISVSEDIAG